MSLLMDTGGLYLGYKCTESYTGS